MCSKDLKKNVSSLLLGTINEIMQVALIENTKKDCYRFTSESITLDQPIRLSLYIKKKHHSQQTAQNDLTLFSFKVTSNEHISFLAFIKEQCMPLLFKIVCKMQELEKESHLAIQTIDENCNEINKTFVLWLETSNGKQNPVKILREKTGTRDAIDNICTVLQLRVLSQINDIIQCGIDIFDLMECIKLMNPLVQLYFYMDIGVVTELKLCDSQIQKCAGYDIYKGPEVVMRKLIVNFVAGNMQVCCSQKFQIKSLSCGITSLSSLLVSCISCFVPIYASKELTDQEIQNYKVASTTGKLKIQVYGPNSLPLDMDLVFNKLPLYPHDLLSWQKFGLQVKKKTTCSPYKLESLVRQTSKESLPSWANTCHHFILLLVFIVEPEDSFTKDKGDLFAEVKLKKELLDKIEKVSLTHDALNSFKEAALSSMSKLFGKSIQPGENPVQTRTKQKLNRDLVQEKSDLFVKMIPEVVNSLVDIFTRSTNTDFRSEVSALVPTGSRVTMSSHLQEKLWKLMEYPKYKMENVDIPPEMAPLSDLLIPTHTQLSTPGIALEDAIDDWDISDDSLGSDREAPMSPDSLDLSKDCEVGADELFVRGELDTSADNSNTFYFCDEHTYENNSAIQNTSSHVGLVMKKIHPQHEHSPANVCKKTVELNSFQMPSVEVNQICINPNTSDYGELSDLSSDCFEMKTPLHLRSGHLSNLSMKSRSLNSVTSVQTAHELESFSSHQKAAANMTLKFSSLNWDLLPRVKDFEQQITFSTLTFQSKLQNDFTSTLDTLDSNTVSKDGSANLSTMLGESPCQLPKKRSADFDDAENGLSCPQSQGMGPELGTEVGKRKKPSHQCYTYLSQNISTASSQTITPGEIEEHCVKPMSNSAVPHATDKFQHVGENDWFDEEELSKWYAEMED